MNEKTPKKGLPGNLNKTELNALIDAVINEKFNQRMEDKKTDPKFTTDAIERKKALKSMTKVRPEDYEEPMTIRDVNIRLREQLDKEGKGAAGKTSQEMKKKTKLFKAKGGMIKGYMGGGSVHKKKNKMATTKGWGASRKT